MANQKVHPGTGWYTLWYTLKLQKTQCLRALVRVVHLNPPLGISPALSGRQVISPTAQPRVTVKPIRGFPNLTEANRTHPSLSEVNYFFRLPLQSHMPDSSCYSNHQSS